MGLYVLDHRAHSWSMATGHASLQSACHTGRHEASGDHGDLASPLFTIRVPFTVSYHQASSSLQACTALFLRLLSFYCPIFGILHVDEWNLPRLTY